MLSTENFYKIMDNYDKLKNITTAKIYENCLKRTCKKYNCTATEFFNAIEIIAYTKFNMKYYN